MDGSGADRSVERLSPEASHRQTSPVPAGGRTSFGDRIELAHLGHMVRMSPGAAVRAEGLQAFVSESLGNGEW